MIAKSKQQILKELQSIPGVGKSISGDLWNLGIRSIDDMKDLNPEQLYQQHCAQMGRLVDRCMLYVFRCAVYFATNNNHDQELLKWWNWKNRD